MNAALHTESDAVARLAAARPLVVDVVPASEVSAHHAAGGVTHAGPPIEPERMCAPMRAALGSALWLEGVAETPAAAIKLVEDGQVPLSTNHDAGGVGPMAGVVNPSMPVWVARDDATGKVAWCPLNEGSGAVLRYGADGPEVLERLVWMRDVLAPELRTALDRAPLDLFDLHVRSLALGDEAHHRTEAGTALTLEALGIEHPEVRAFIAGNGQFFLNLAMVFAKLALDCAADVSGSPVLTAIARNGVEVGIRVSGLGDRWFVGPAALPAPAKLFDGYSPADMNPDLGDSAIVETYGLGALAVAASPLSAPSVGLDPKVIDEIDTGLRAIAAGESPEIRFPDGRAAILGVDARKVAATRISPPVHTGIAHKRPGIGQIGGGITHPPLQAFDLAVAALDAR
ncbi:DUF1116 domain-containing protein [Solirubrobacter sp. CPCC 204708]|uniref:DUF1116 domain-containing protein n=1 Tax=Solirubrobacter deserti TaxID=2282478 RepID=A0ABT4RC25_9ACTN|nr:DUF1116 domain-containing protein [Solirubrobacter deserti]MBE2317171.1 DUF1116 domain-containing protein [Solirubrobacter deserti]MDA0135936.1 DUF1116 domain-containing protein [Solirubrobacter deserti]